MVESECIIVPELLAMLVCPIDHADLELRDSALVCTKCGRTYPIVDGIPNMVADES